MGKLIPECPPMWVTAVLYGGPFAASLRLLLQNDSVMDLGSKGRIYGELLRLLNVLGMLPSEMCYPCVRYATIRDMSPMCYSSLCQIV